MMNDVSSHHEFTMTHPDTFYYIQYKYLPKLCSAKWNIFFYDFYQLPIINIQSTFYALCCLYRFLAKFPIPPQLFTSFPNNLVVLSE